MNINPSTEIEALDALRDLVRSKPSSRSEMKTVARQAVELAHHLQVSRTLADIPEVVWHFLSDVDIRFKDSEYAELQEKHFLEAIEKMETHAI